MPKMTIKQYEQGFKSLVKRDRRAAIKALIIIYCYQDPDEQYYGKSQENNGKGFSRHDAKELTELVIHLKHTNRMTEAQIAKLQNVIGKYWRQIMPIMKKTEKHPKGFNGMWNLLTHNNNGYVTVKWEGHPDTEIDLLSKKQRRIKGHY